MTERPNILFILTDDQGPWALRCAGNDEIRTPGLDRIAATGVRFEHFLCASPVCSPSRASFLTGRMPSQHGVHDWIREGNVGDNAARYLAGETAYTDVLAAHGYKVGPVGQVAPRPQPARPARVLALVRPPARRRQLQPPPDGA